MTRVDAYVWFGPMVAEQAVTAMQRQIGERLHVPCSRMVTDDLQQVYSVTLLEHSGSVADACTIVEREVLRWAAEHATPGGVDVTRLHAWREQ